MPSQGAHLRVEKRCPTAVPKQSTCSLQPDCRRLPPPPSCTSRPTHLVVRLRQALLAAGHAAALHGARGAAASDLSVVSAAVLIIGGIHGQEVAPWVCLRPLQEGENGSAYGRPPPQEPTNAVACSNGCMPAIASFSRGRASPNERRGRARILLLAQQASHLVKHRLRELHGVQDMVGCKQSSEAGERAGRWAPPYRVHRGHPTDASRL